MTDAQAEKEPKTGDQPVEEALHTRGPVGTEQVIWWVEPTPDGRFWLLWDKPCGLCRRIIAWIRRHDSNELIRAIPFQDAPAPPMTPDLVRACSRAIHLIAPDGRVVRAGRAVVEVLALLGRRRTAAVLARPPLIWLIEGGYRVVAENRPLFARFLFRNE